MEMEMEMEMVENQLQNSLKIKEEEEEEDRISLLPDGVLVEFLSRLPETKEAIKTGILSKRWEHVWTSVPTLIFHNLDHNHPRSVFYSLVDKTLTQCSHQLKLDTFELISSYNRRHESQINKWIRFVITRNVEKLTLVLLYKPCEAQFLSHDSLYINSSLTHLKLGGCVLNPTCSITWKNLNTLRIASTKVDDDLIQNILSGSPLLETLQLNLCYGYKRIDISSKSVKNLVVSGYAYTCGDYLSNDVIEINAPTVLSLTIQDDLLLSKILLLDVSSLVKANLDFWIDDRYHRYKKMEEEMLKGFILKFHHVKEFEMGRSCFKVLSRLEAKGFIYPSDIKFPDVASEDSE